MRGGARPGAGRPKGSRTVDQQMIREAIQSGEDIAGTSLEYLQKVYQGKIRNADPKRIEAARAAAPYEFPRLTDATIRTAQTDVEKELEGKSPEERTQWRIEKFKTLFDAEPELKSGLAKALGLVEKAEPASGESKPALTVIK